MAGQPLYPSLVGDCRVVLVEAAADLDEMCKSLGLPDYRSNYGCLRCFAHRNTFADLAAPSRKRTHDWLLDTAATALFRLPVDDDGAAELRENSRIKRKRGGVVVSSVMRDKFPLLRRGDRIEPVHPGFPDFWHGERDDPLLKLKAGKSRKLLPYVVHLLRDQGGQLLLDDADPAMREGTKLLTVGTGLLDYSEILRGQPRRMDELAVLHLESVIFDAMAAWISTGRKVVMKFHVGGTLCGHASGMCIPDAQHVRAPLRTRIVLGGSGGNGEKRAEDLGTFVSVARMARWAVVLKVELPVGSGELSARLSEERALWASCLDEKVGHLVDLMGSLEQRLDGLDRLGGPGFQPAAADYDEELQVESGAHRLSSELSVVSSGREVASSASTGDPHRLEGAGKMGQLSVLDTMCRAVEALQDQNRIHRSEIKALQAQHVEQRDVSNDLARGLESVKEDVRLLQAVPFPLAADLEELRAQLFQNCGDVAALRDKVLVRLQSYMCHYLLSQDTLDLRMPHRSHNTNIKGSSDTSSRHSQSARADYRDGDANGANYPDYLRDFEALVKHVGRQRASSPQEMPDVANSATDAAVTSGDQGFSQAGDWPGEQLHQAMLATGLIATNAMLPDPESGHTYTDNSGHRRPLDIQRQIEQLLVAHPTRVQVLNIDADTDPEVRSLLDMPEVRQWDMHQCMFGEDAEEGPAIRLPKVPVELFKFVQGMEGGEGNAAKQFFEGLEKVIGDLGATKSHLIYNIAALQGEVQRQGGRIGALLQATGLERADPPHVRTDSAPPVDAPPGERRRASRERRSASPERRSASPERRGASPDRRSASPDRRSASPDRRSQRLPAAPRRLHGAPRCLPRGEARRFPLGAAGRLPGEAEAEGCAAGRLRRGGARGLRVKQQGQRAVEGRLGGRGRQARRGRGRADQVREAALRRVGRPGQLLEASGLRSSGGGDGGDGRLWGRGGDQQAALDGAHGGHGAGVGGPVWLRAVLSRISPIRRGLPPTSGSAAPRCQHSTVSCRAPSPPIEICGVAVSWCTFGACPFRETSRRQGFEIGGAHHPVPPSLPPPLPSHRLPLPSSFLPLPSTPPRLFNPRWRRGEGMWMRELCESPTGVEGARWSCPSRVSRGWS
ncbi:unnamed protein product [Prorocentrum cordatum]|uniref:Uncharacterized protein n=1 Tax=Prorocentrum cordatum TaxID=2364126 RepID=A0ABN9Y5N7_9DINO|nr:unnamed protein product [Polarella glacialis]